jgi:hypothetical protein
LCRALADAAQHCARDPAARRFDLKHFINRPSEHLQKYPMMLEAVLRETDAENPDRDYLAEAVHAITNLQTTAQLLTFQASMGKGAAGKLQWHDLVAEPLRASIPKAETKRQS